MDALICAWSKASEVLVSSELVSFELVFVSPELELFSLLPELRLCRPLPPWALLLAVFAEWNSLQPLSLAFDFLCGVIL